MEYQVITNPTSTVSTLFPTLFDKLPKYVEGEEEEYQNTYYSPWPEAVYSNIPWCDDTFPFVVEPNNLKPEKTIQKPKIAIQESKLKKDAPVPANKQMCHKCNEDKISKDQNALFYVFMELKRNLQQQHQQQQLQKRYRASLYNNNRKQ